MNEYKYSDWFKIDLHIHTDWSKRTKANDYKGIFSIDTLREKMIANDVGILSLTDHNIINVPAYEEYYSKYTSNDALLLLGIELDIIVATPTGDRTYHSLLIFNYSSSEKVKYINAKLESKYTEKGIPEPKERSLTINEIVEIFHDDDFFFIPHAYSDKNIVSANKGQLKDAQKMVLLMQSALEKVTREEIQDAYNKGFNLLLADSFKERHDIPYINFSDNHNIQQYPCIHKGDNEVGDHSFYYIKGKKCYESIRLAFIDPESRIMSTTDYNSINRTINTIDKLKIENNDLIINSELQFSPHLNVIIGGRSSGKSLLFWALGKKISYPNLENRYDKFNIDSFQIKSKLDNNYNTNTSLTDGFIYINQGDITKYFEEKKLSDLAKKSDKYNEYQLSLSQFENHKSLLLQKKQEFTNSYKTTLDISDSKSFILHLSTLENCLNTKYIFKLKYDKLVADYDETTKITESEGLLNTITENLVGLKEKGILGISQEEEVIIDSFNQLIHDKISLINRKKSHNQKILQFISSVHKTIEETNQTLDTEAQQKTISIAHIKQLKDDIKNVFVKMKDLKDKSDSLENFDISFKQNISLGDNISLVLEAVKHQEIKVQILDAINGAENSKTMYYNIVGLMKKTKSIKSFGGNLHENLNKKIDTQLKIVLSELSNPKDYLDYSDGETSKDKSPGYNSEKYLEIILNNLNTKTIFIDQPEDNLGNRFISDGLVNIIRKIKFQKQIFLVTHNPSIVVYGDAECVILAKNTNNIITYEQIVLEDQDAQKEICNTLDGGEYIFNNRSRKYNIQRILKEV